MSVDVIGAAIDLLPDVAEAVRARGAVVDVGCGYGTPTRAIAELYPGARVLGVDYHDASIAQARVLAAEHGPDTVSFEVAAAERSAEAPDEHPAGTTW